MHRLGSTKNKQTNKQTKTAAATKQYPAHSKRGNTNNILSLFLSEFSKTICY